MKDRNWITKTSLRCTLAASAILTLTLGMAAEQPKFETASVKPSKQCSFQNSVDPGMIALNSDPLRVVLMEAFKVKKDQIVGPSWLDTDCFAVVAKIPDGATKDQFPAMFQALLVERFKLAAHKETRLRSGYALVVDKNGPKFKESDPNTSYARAHAGQVRFGAGPQVSGIKGAITMAALAHFVAAKLDTPVQDLTGLKGKYDIDVSWVPDRTIEKMGPFAQHYAATHPDSPDGEASAPTPAAGDIFTAFRNSLGLRLESRKQQVEVVVIDHIERIPTAN